MTDRSKRYRTTIRWASMTIMVACGCGGRPSIDPQSEGAQTVSESTQPPSDVRPTTAATDGPMRLSPRMTSRAKRMFVNGDGDVAVRVSVTTDTNDRQESIRQFVASHEGEVVAGSGTLWSVELPRHCIDGLCNVPGVVRVDAGGSIAQHHDSSHHDSSHNDSTSIDDPTSVDR